MAELVEKIALITPGQKISYITDVAYSDANAKQIVDLVEGSDHLYIEAVFRDEHKELAAEKKHLTTSQAGRLASPITTSATCMMSHAATPYSTAIRKTLRRLSSDTIPMSQY